jgi:hypothetical protein
VTTAGPLAAALKAAPFGASDTAIAVRTLFPSITAAQLAVVLKQIFQP